MSIVKSFVALLATTLLASSWADIYALADAALGPSKSTAAITGDKIRLAGSYALWHDQPATNWHEALRVGHLKRNGKFTWSGK